MSSPNPARDIDGIGSLIIPKLSFRIKRRFDEIGGQRIRNAGKKPFLYEATSDVMFKLGEYGATFKAFSKVEGVKSASPLSLLFNRPFMIILKQKKSALPYLLIWIDNTEILLKQDTKEN